jgi:hypothetical protein
LLHSRAQQPRKSPSRWAPTRRDFN